MRVSLDCGKKAGMMVLVIITIITMGTASSAPLDVSIEEKVNATVVPSVDSTGAITFSYATNVTGYVNITNQGNDVLYDVWVAVKLVNNSTPCALYYSNASSQVSINPAIPDKIDKPGVFNTSGANCFIHIPLLKPNELVSVFYDVNDASMGIADGAPFSVSERYDPSKIPARGEYTWTVYFNVSLNKTWFEKTAISLTNNNVLLNITKYLSNDTNNFGSENWKLLEISGTPTTTKGTATVYNGNYTNADNSTIVIRPISLNTTQAGNEYVNITFQVKGNYTNSTSAPYYFEPFGFAVFSFNLSFGNVSGSKIVDVFAMGNASVNVTKYGPDENGNWYGNASITNKASGLTYILTNVTMWATGQGSFSNVIQNSYQEWTPNVQLSPGGSWNTSQGSPQGISFQYNAVPIIWANATFKLINSESSGWFANNTTLYDYNATYGSNFIVIEKIYIIGTYLVKVTKHVMFNKTDGDKSVFDVYLVVENIGGEESPYVYVYDLIPENFSEYNWDESWTDADTWNSNYVNKSSMFAGNGSVEGPMTGYVTGHYWRLMPIAPEADGDGSYEDWDEIENNQTVVIFYQMAGSGDFKVLDAFIVGIDPMYSLNEQTSPKTVLVSGAKATNYETTLATFTFASMGALLLIYKRRNGRNGS
ncbi:MAG: hypothetical protein QXO16_00770 [Archaeoglobaceae archaeon]